MILDDLSERAKDNNSLILVVRHSEKQDTPLGDPFYDVSLTPKGHEMAMTFGYKLVDTFSQPIVHISTSPILRCVETSQDILSSFDSNTMLSKSRILGDPGPYVMDDTVVGETFLNLPQGSNILKMQVESTIDLPGFRTLGDGSALLLKYLFSFEEEGVKLFVTHDVIVGALIGYFTGYVPDIPDWIKYLHGACFYQDGRRMMMETIDGQFDITEKTDALLKGG